ncbi:MAG: site-2 protease family protein, partial [Planctomycetota bacterium]|nr:site-2 protease family protein [Planctomycetota bacterium]
CGDMTAGLVRLTDRDGRTLVWTDSAMFCTPSAPLSPAQVLQTARNRGPLYPAGAAGGSTLFIPGSLALTAAVIEKAGLAEQPDGAFVRVPPREGAAPCPAIEHPSPEDRAPGIDMKSRRLKQLLLLVAGFAALSYVCSTFIAISLLAFLLFHEYGHAVAMKWCGVRVEGIFILPFMGAVAVAKDEAGTRWKEFIIAIMGSIFGAALTLAVFIAALATLGAYPVLTDATEWCALLSLFNLLPLGMMDGGRVMTSIAFSTHRVLGTIASVLAIVLCLAAAIALQSWLLGLVAAFTVLQMRAASNAYKRSAALVGVGCTAAGLRRGIAATWQRIGVLSAEGDATQAQKARRAVRTLESFRRFFTGLFEIPRMTPGRIVAAIVIYAATVGFFLVLLAGSIILGFSVKTV